MDYDDLKYTESKHYTLDDIVVEHLTLVVMEGGKVVVRASLAEMTQQLRELGFTDVGSSLMLDGGTRLRTRASLTVVEA